MWQREWVDRTNPHNGSGTIVPSLNRLPLKGWWDLEKKKLRTTKP